MKYRTKLYISFVGLAVASSLIGISIIYKASERYLWKELASKVVSIAASVAAEINGDPLKNINQPQDIYTPEYREIAERLNRAVWANQRNDVNVKYIYTIAPSPINPGQLIYQIDNTVFDAPDALLPGEPYLEEDASELWQHRDVSFSTNRFVRDEWGLWFSGFSPIYDNKGNYVATLGVDIESSYIQKQLDQFLYFGLIGLLAAVVLAVIAAYFLSKRVSRSLAILSSGVKEIGDGNLNVKVEMDTHDEFHDLAISITNMARGLRERERLKTSFASYVSSHIIEKILKSEKPIKLEGERRKVTILFSDIRDFTTLSEKLEPEEVVGLLNNFFRRMIDVIFKNNGTLDKFLGDGLMVEFSIPLDDPLQETHAIMTALEMQRELRNLNKELAEMGKPPLQIGIGIHTGFAIVGNIGSEKRMEYTAIGDTVNVASRIEEKTKELKASILVSEATMSAIKESQFKATKVGPVTLHGRTEPIIVYEIHE